MFFLLVFAFEDLNEVPLCECAVSADNLVCDAFGKPPNPSVVVQVTAPNGGWIKYGRTEVIEVRIYFQEFCCGSLIELLLIF